MANLKKKEILRRRNKNENPVNSFYTSVIESENMNCYKSIIQTGAKKGQSLFSHIENMAGTAAGVINILEIPNIETKVLLTSIAVHDLNKVPDYSSYNSYLDIISEQNVSGEYINIIKECERIDIDKFFPNYKEYLYDIREIIGRHSAHLNSFGETLYCDSTTKLDKDIIDKLVYLIRAVDCVDLSKDFYEELKKEQFLQNINKVSIENGIMFKFIWHKFSDNRGDLSNSIDSLVMKLMKKNECYPLLLYPQGSYYLVNKAKNFDSDIKSQIINKTVSFLKNKILNDIDNFIVNKQAGIVVDDKAFEVADIESIVWKINTRANEFKLLGDESVNKKNKIINLHFMNAKEKYKGKEFKTFSKKVYSLEKCIDKIEEELLIADKKQIKVLNKSLKEKQKEVLKSKEDLNGYKGYEKLIELLKEDVFSLSRNEEINRLSEFLRATYNMLNTYVAKKDTNFAWNEIYKVLNLNDDVICYLNLITSKDALYHRPYLMGELLYEKYKDDKRDNLVNKFAEYFKENITLSEENKDDMWKDLEKYIDGNLIFSFEKKGKVLYKNSLENYLNPKIGNCTLCGSDFKATDWMAIDVPCKIKVQNFSNRIRAGANEPRRKVCNICRIEYLLNKVTYNTKVEVSRRYISMYPKGFNTIEKLDFLKESFREFNERDIKSIFFDSYTSYYESALSSIKAPKFSQGSLYGLSVPSSEEIIGSSVTLPVNFDSKSIDSKIYIDSLMQAVYFNQYFDMRISVTEQPYLTENFNYTEEICISNIPIAYGNLFKPTLTKSEVIKTFNLFKSLFELAKKLGQGNDYIYDMLRALNGGKFNFIYELYKSVKRMENDSKKKSNKYMSMMVEIKIIADKVLEYLKEEEILTNIEKLSSYASDKKIFGSLGDGLKDHSISKPLLIVLDLVLKSDLTVMPLAEIGRAHV